MDCGPTLECPCGSSNGTCRLNGVAVGEGGRVLSVAGDPDVRRRLLEMGFCKGTPVEVVRRAPLGDPIEFKLRGYHLSLRSEQAQHVLIAAGR